MSPHLEQALSDLLSKSSRMSDKQYREIVSILLDSHNLDPDAREEEFKAAIDLFSSQNRSKASSLEDVSFAKAAQILNETASVARHSNWYGTILESWPAPIAHEIAQLIALMSDETANVAMADTVLGQFRDAYEVLIKFTSITLVQALADAGEEDRTWAKSSLYTRTSLGGWVALLREAARRLQRQESMEDPVWRLAKVVGSELLPGANSFAEIRNNLIGHGARALEPKETAQSLETCLLGGKLRSPSGEDVSIPGLFPILERMVEAKVFSDIDLVIEVGGNRITLAGSEPLIGWIQGDHGDRHDFETEGHSVCLVSKDGHRLDLSPLIAARVCTKCGHRDIVLYDALQSGDGGGKFDLIDYARGHKSRFRGADAEDLAIYFANMPKPEPVSAGTGRSRADQRVIEALDRARVDRRYQSPTYLREVFADFLQSQKRGVFWLQAPAHVGKTTFVQGLVSPDSVNERTPILPRFATERGGFILGYYIRREIRVGIADFMNTLEENLRRRFTSQATIDKSPHRPVNWAETAGPAEFVAWLVSWRQFALDWNLLEQDAPFVLAIDGLDEAEDPDVAVLRNGSLIRLLPSEDILPDGIYMLLTSRLPDGPDEVPAFLKERVAALYPANS